MLMTRECDYAVRILRALADGEMKSVVQICRAEDLKTAIAYKLTRKLEQAGILNELQRGRRRLCCGEGCRESLTFMKSAGRWIRTCF